MAGIRALADAGSAMLEVNGKVVLRRARRFSDFANHPDPLMEVHKATVRLHSGAGSEVWEEVEGLSLNRDSIILVIPVEEDDPGASSKLHVPGHEIRAKLVCGGAQVTGFVRVPLQATVASFMRESRLRFLSVASARIAALPGGGELQDVDRFLPFCLVNRMRVTACVEGRATSSGGQA